MALPRPVHIAGRALGTMGRHAGVTAAAVALAALVLALADLAVYELLLGNGPRQGNQELAIGVMLAQAANYLAFQVLLGPLFVAAAIYLVRQDHAGRPAGLRGAVNFALSRFGRLFLPHMAAQLSIQIGLQLLLVPGLLFYGMYAFVDPVACLEDESWPLDRSKKLTRGRRGTIMWLVIPLIVIVMVKGFVLDLPLAGAGLSQAILSAMGQVSPDVADVVKFLSATASIVLSMLFEFFFAAAFAWLYLERVTGSAKPATEKAPASA